MPYPPLANYATEAEYRAHYERIYCTGPILTFDGIEVRFRKNKFGHCFFESTRRDGVKDLFSKKRAARIDWIKAALQDSDSERFVGWDKVKKRYDRRRRVTIVMRNYVVVIQLTESKRADFVTAYLADTQGRGGKFSSVEQIRRGPKWP